MREGDTKGSNTGVLAFLAKLASSAFLWLFGILAAFFAVFCYITRGMSTESVVPTHETRPAFPISIDREEIIVSTNHGFMPDSDFEMRLYYGELTASASSITDLIGMYRLEPWSYQMAAVAESMTTGTVPEWFVAGVNACILESGARAFKSRCVKVLTVGEKVFIKILLATEPLSFASMSLTDADKALEASLDTRSSRALIDQAVASRRMDLIRLCFTHRSTFRDAVSAIGRIGDDGLKSQVTLMMLRTPSLFWPSEVPSRGPPETNEVLLVEPFVSVITQHLRDVRPAETMLLTRTERENLANALEAAMGKGDPRADAPLR